MESVAVPSFTSGTGGDGKGVYLGEHYLYPGDYVAVLPEFCLVGHRAVPFGGDRRIILDALRTSSRPYTAGLISRCLLPPPIYLPGTTTVLAVGNRGNFYHWLFDVLSILSVLETAGHNTTDFDNVIVDPIRAPFQEESLRIFGVDLSRCIEVNESTFLKAETLVLASRRPASPKPARVSSFLREKVRGFIDESREPDAEPHGKQGSRLYISRHRSRRNITNEIEVLNLLQEYGFAAVHLEKMSFLEQAVAFRNADVILGPHGAGFANLIHCRQGTKVVEFVPPAWRNGTSAAIAIHMNLDYYYLMGDGRVGLTNCSNISRDFFIDTAELRAVLAGAGVRPGRQTALAKERVEGEF